MKLTTERTGPIDLDCTPIHLGLGSRAQVVEGFGWDETVLQAYSEAVAADGPEGRLVMNFQSEASWTSWECHPAGEEVVICLSGRFAMIQEIDGAEHRVELTAGEAVINPRGVWHTADVIEPGRFMTITPGIGTEHRPR